MRRRERQSLIADINVVPYIDVMLVLLVIFMITAPLLSQGIQVNLPTAHAKIIKDNRDPLILSIDRDNHYYLNVSKHPKTWLSPDNTLTTAAAAIKLAGKKKPLPVFVKADQSLTYGQVIRAMALLKTAGAQQIGMITRPS